MGISRQFDVVRIASITLDESESTSPDLKREAARARVDTQWQRLGHIGQQRKHGSLPKPGLERSLEELGLDGHEKEFLPRLAARCEGRVGCHTNPGGQIIYISCIYMGVRGNMEYTNMRRITPSARTPTAEHESRIFDHHTHALHHLVHP